MHVWQFKILEAENRKRSAKKRKFTISNPPETQKRVWSKHQTSFKKISTDLVHPDLILHVYYNN